MEFLQGLPPGAARDGLGLGLLEISLQRIEEKRVDNLMDVIRARKVLPIGAAVVMRERALEDGAEDGRAHARPIEFLAAVDEQRRAERLVEGRDLRAFTEETAVHVGQDF